MDTEKSPLPAPKPADEVPKDSAQAPVSTSTVPPKKTTKKVPEGYKLVKKSQPDGTFKTVLRPIAKDAVTGDTSASVVSGKESEKPAKSITGTSSPPKPPTKVVQQPAKSQAVPANPQSQEAAPEGLSNTAISTTNKTDKPSAEKPSSTETSVAASKKTETTPVHTSKLDAVSKSARIFGRFHRFHRHASRLAGAFDSDLVDYDGDITVSDDSYDDDSDNDSDDSDTNHHNQQNNRSKWGNGSQETAASTARILSNTSRAPATYPKKPQISVTEKTDSKNSGQLPKESSAQEKELLPAERWEDGTSQRRAPRPLPDRYDDWERLVVWALIIMLPIAFIGLGIATACLDKKPTTYKPTTVTDDYVFVSEVYVNTRMSATIKYATKAAITAWPIVFAAILAQTLKAFATFQVERGIRLMTLEQLISSHSVASAIKQPFVLRSLNWITLGLLALWSLSPLGSQAMQYTTYTYKNIQHVISTMYYLDTTQENPGLSSNWQAVNNYSDSMDVLFAAVFQQKTQFQPKGSDPWGNPLLPVYEYLQTDPLLVNTSLMTEVNDPLTTDYASYYGIPLSGLDEFDADFTGTWNFTMESSYLYLDCPSLFIYTEQQILDDLTQYNPDISNLTDFPSTLSGSLRMNMTVPTPSDYTGNLIFISDCSAAKTADGERTYAFSLCSLSQTFVSSYVSCDNTNCTVIRTQKHPSHGPSTMTAFESEFLKSSDTGLSAYPDIGDSPYSITELYLRDPTNATEPGTGLACDLGPLVNDTLEFTGRLSYLLNTFYSTGFTHDFTIGSLPEPPFGNVTLSDPITGEDYSVPITGTAKDAVHTYQDDLSPELWGINWAFIAIFEFCALTLLLIGLAGIVLEDRTIAPDVLGWVSNLARQSKYVKLPKVEGDDGVMSGAERARKARDTMVMMQEIRGRIVLGNVTEGAARLEKGKVYR